MVNSWVNVPSMNPMGSYSWWRWQAVRREIDSDITDYQRYDVSGAREKLDETKYRRFDAVFPIAHNIHSGCDCIYDIDDWDLYKENLGVISNHIYIRNHVSILGVFCILGLLHSNHVPYVRCGFRGAGVAYTACHTDRKKCDPHLRTKSFDSTKWLSFELLGVTYLVGKIKFELLFDGPLAE